MPVVEGFLRRRFGLQAASGGLTLALALVGGGWSAPLGLVLGVIGLGYGVIGLLRKEPVSPLPMVSTGWITRYVVTVVMIAGAVAAPVAVVAVVLLGAVRLAAVDVLVLAAAVPGVSGFCLHFAAVVWTGPTRYNLRLTARGKRRVFEGRGNVPALVLEGVNVLWGTALLPALAVERVAVVHLTHPWERRPLGAADVVTALPGPAVRFDFSATPEVARLLGRQWFFPADDPAAVVEAVERRQRSLLKHSFSGKRHER